MTTQLTRTRLTPSAAYQAGDARLWQSADGLVRIQFVRRAWGVSMEPHFHALRRASIDQRFELVATKRSLAAAAHVLGVTVMTTKSTQTLKTKSDAGKATSAKPAKAAKIKHAPAEPATIPLPLPLLKIEDEAPPAAVGQPAVLSVTAIATEGAAKPAKLKAAKLQSAKAAKPAHKKLSCLEAAARVLAETGQAMSCPQLIEAMATKGYWSSPGGQTPAATLYSAILREIGKRQAEARFVKTERGQFILRGKE
jgi:hypothetical protein